MYSKVDLDFECVMGKKVQIQMSSMSSHEYSSGEGELQCFSIDGRMESTDSPQRWIFPSNNWYFSFLWVKTRTSIVRYESKVIHHFDRNRMKVISHQRQGYSDVYLCSSYHLERSPCGEDPRTAHPCGRQRLECSLLFLPLLASETINAKKWISSHGERESNDVCPKAMTWYPPGRSEDDVRISLKR